MSDSKGRCRMAVLTIIANGIKKRVACETGVLVSQALQAHGFTLTMPCAGKGICGKCQVKTRGLLSEPTWEERRALSQEELRMGIRLACMARIAGDAEISWTENSGSAYVVGHGVAPDFDSRPDGEGWAAAVDVGTTTVASYLYRLPDCTPAGRTGGANPQAVWGADVISRMERAIAGEGEALNRAIAGEIDRQLSELARQAGIACGEIRQMVITANTAMLYLLAGICPEELTHAPFTASRQFGEWRTGEALGITCAPKARIYLPRCASAFVGADITTAILASGMIKEQGNCLLLDIGTNGEMALRADGRIICCSTAAGPALEGGNIRMGMPALPGAIDSVRLEQGKIRHTTIGGCEAKGLCGSGLLDAAAVLLEAGVVEETGAIAEEGHDYLDFLCQVDGQPAFRLPGSQVMLTQRDIRNVQLAKGAICAGMLTLLSRAGLGPGEIKTLYLAGGFGSFIRIDSAARIGLIPKALAGKTNVIGNAAGAGACMLLQNRGFKTLTEEMAERMETVELSQNPLFSQYYMDCMLLEPVL